MTLSLIELLIVVAIILIIAAITIPNLLRSKMAANDFYYGSLQAVRRAQKYYLAFLLALLAFVWVSWRKVFGSLVIASMFSLAIPGQGCPHAGPDHRLLGRTGCWVQRELTIESAQPPSTIWSFSLGKVSVKIDPKHPHLLIEWPANSGKVWRFRAGYRWDANARAYIFPSLAIKKVDGPMREYQL